MSRCIRTLCAGAVAAVMYVRALAAPVATLPGDCDLDWSVDLADLSGLATCLDGPDIAGAEECACYGLDDDGDVDLHDFAAFQTAFTGTQLLRIGIANDADDGTEENDTTWHADGLGGTERNQMGASGGSSYDVGLRFLVPEVRQGETFVYARLVVSATGDGQVDSQVTLGSVQSYTGLAAPRRQVSGPASAYFCALEMIGRVTGSSAVVHLVTSENLSVTVQARVRWGEAPEGLPTSPDVSPVVSTSAPLTALELEISGLQPNHKYYYLVQYETSDAPGVWVDMPNIGEFHSQKTAGQSFSFGVLADPHWGAPLKVPPGSPRRWNGEQCLQRILAEEEFDLCIDLGDSAYLTQIRSYDEALARYGDYREVMADITRKMPAFIVLGNHEREAGFFQKGTDDPPEYLWNGLSSTEYHQKWATEARLRFVPNPRGDTYPEGGEGAPGYDTAAEWGAGSDPWNNGTSSNIQNFYAWTWGDALFIVLDPGRYTLVGSTTVTNSPSQWTLGPTQLQWLEDVLVASTAKWRFVLAHHLVGGGLISPRGEPIPDGGTKRAYARGSAIEADRPDTEHALVHQLMVQYGAQFFLYGHDHGFCHSVKDGIHYICCGRPTYLSDMWSREGMLESYGSILVQGQDKDWVKALYHVLGYTRFHVTDDAVTMEWIRTGYSFPLAVVPIDEAQRDWLESWLGKAYPVNDPPSSVSVTMVPTDVGGVRTVAGATLSGFFEVPTSEDYYEQPDPVRPEDFTDTEVPIEAFPESVAVVDTVPELIYKRTWLYRGDQDDDGDRDLADYAAMQECYSPDAGSVPPTEACAKMDMDEDEDVDLEDFGEFMSGFGGPQ